MGYENHQITIDGMTNRICIIGHFGFGYNLLNGQTIKTHIIANELEKQMKDIVLSKIDTHNFKNKLLLLPRSFYALIKNDNIIILPAHNALLIEVPWLILWNYIFNRNLHYVVIGGWLVTFIEKHLFVKSLLRRFNGIYVETDSMKKALDKNGFNNVNVLPNCKPLKILKEEELVNCFSEPYQLVTFSRVMEQKGIEDAVRSVKIANERIGHNAFKLTIYGQIEHGQESWFANLQKQFNDFIIYGGFVDYDKSTDVLRESYALLFPTFYEGEGFAGTILDAFASGLPVIASDWKYNSQIVEHLKTGCIFPVRDVDMLASIIVFIYNHQSEWVAMKYNCLREAFKYTPQLALRPLLKALKYVS